MTKRFALTLLFVVLPSFVHAQQTQYVRPFGNGYTITNPNNPGGTTYVRPFGNGYTITNPNNPAGTTYIRPFGNGYTITQPNADPFGR